MLAVFVTVSHASNIESTLVAGKVINVDDNTVQITVSNISNIQIGDKVNLYHKTSFGDEMEVGEWKVSKMKDKTIVAMPIDAYIPPTVGMISKIHTSVKKDNIEVLKQNHHNAPSLSYVHDNQKSIKAQKEDPQPYVEKAKLLANDYYKDPKKYTKSMSDKLWNEIIVNINKAISLGNAEAYFLLAMIYEDGYADYKADMKKMVHYITKSAEQGYIEAQYILGEMYADGDEVMKDKNRAIEWYEKALANGHEGAKSALDKLKRQYPDITPELRGKEPLNYGFGKKDDLHDLLDIEK